MTRAVSIGRGSIGQPRLPERLPSGGAGLVGQTIANEAAAARQEITGLLRGRAAREREELQRLSDAQSRGQLKQAGEVLNNLGLQIADDIERSPEDTFRSQQSALDLAGALEQRVDQDLQEFRNRVPLSEDAALVFDNELPAFREALTGAIERGITSRTRSILRADATRDAELRLGAVQTFEDVEDQASRVLVDVFIPELFDDNEAAARVDLWRQRAYQEVLQQAYDADTVEAAALAFDLPDELLDPEFVRNERRAAKAALERDFDPVTGEYGFETLRRDVQFTAADSLTIGANPNLIDEVFGSKVALIKAKRLDFLRNSQTVERVLGKQAVAAIDDNFRVIIEQLRGSEATIDLAYGMLSGELAGAGPFDPTTNEAAEMAATLGGRLQALDQIADIREYGRAFADDIESYTTMPRSYAAALLSGFTNSRDPRAQARAAYAFGELYERGDFTMLGPGSDTVPESMALQMLMIHNQVKRLKVGPAQAVENVLERTREFQVVDLAEEFQKVHAEGQFDALEGFSDTWVPFEETAELDFPSAMIQDFNELTLLYYMQSNGDVDVARRYAWAQLQASWGVTRDFEGQPRWAHRPVEKEYVSGVGGDAWQKEQFVEDFERHGKGPLDLERIMLVPVENPRDPAHPAYMVMRLEEGGLPTFVETLLSTENSPEIFVWVPDVTTSPAARRAREAAERRRKELLEGETAFELRALRRNVEQAIGVIGAEPASPADERFLLKAETMVLMIDEVLRTAENPRMPASSFEAALQAFQDRIPLTPEELSLRGVNFDQWRKAMELVRLKERRTVIETSPPPEEE